MVELVTPALLKSSRPYKDPPTLVEEQNPGSFESALCSCHVFDMANSKAIACFSKIQGFPLRLVSIAVDQLEFSSNKVGRDLWWWHN